MQQEQVHVIEPEFDLESNGILPEEIISEVNKFNPLKEVTGLQLITEAPDKMDWLVKDLFLRTGLACLAGGSDLGKSALLRELAIAIATRANDFLGWPLILKHASAIVVCTEDDRRSISFLLKRQTKEMGTVNLHNLRFLFDFESLENDLAISLENKPADIVIFDCFADVYADDLKDTQKIRAFLNRYQQLSTKHNCLFLFLHHTAKRTENIEPSKNNLLSGQGFESKMRLVIELRADMMNPNYRHFCIVKGNYLPASMKRESYVLRFCEDNFLFHMTDERTPFELLVKQAEDSGKAKYEQAKELKDKGYNYEQIAEKLGLKSKGSITKIFQNAEKNNWH